MIERIERDDLLPATPEEVWNEVIGPDWLAEEVSLELCPGGEASFRDDDGRRTGWVEEALAPRRLVFWWARGDEPATRVDVALAPEGEGTRLRVVETRPLEVLDVVGLPLPGSGGALGPTLVAA